MRLSRSSLLIVLPLALSACGVIGGPAGPPPLEVPPTTPLPAAEIRLVVQAPADTPGDARIEVELLDEVSGFGTPLEVVPMEGSDGTWSVRLTPPAGSLIYYRFVRTSPTRSPEATARGEPVVARLALIDGPGEFHEVIAAWSDSTDAPPTGRIVGTLFDALTGTALSDMLVSAGGRTTFTDGQGAFRIDDLAPGLHSLVAVSPSGAYLPVQQGAIVADSSETPATLGMPPAASIIVTFQVIVPPDTPPEVPLRVAGNVLPLGSTFAGLKGGIPGSVGTMPQLVRVEPTSFVGVVNLHAGTDLSYRYTLGDGIWNTERDATGAVVTRQVVLPDTDLTLTDVVSTWHVPSTPGLTFHVRSASGMPPSDQVSLQLWGNSWAEPIPMWPAGPAEWTYTLFGPLQSGVPLDYRYCRNQLCGTADDADTALGDAAARQVVAAAEHRTQTDEVRAWAWWQADLQGAVVVAPEIQPRPGFEVGFEFAPAYTPTWLSSAAPSLGVIAESGANAILLAPAWVLRENDPIPQIAFDPQHSPLLEDLIRQVSQAADRGLAAGLHPALISPQGSVDEWWTRARRDSAWWTVFFERYRAFLLTYAVAAEKAGASKLVLGGPEVAPALPDGQLADGTPSGAPIDAEERWRSLIQEVRLLYGGPIAFEIEFGPTLQAPPPFIDAVDHVHVYWHVPLSEGASPSPAEMQAAAFAALDGSLLSEESLKDKPLFLSVEYLSIEGSAAACAPLPDGTCRPPQAFDAGHDPDPDLNLGLTDQSEALNAVILAAYAREGVQGFYARRYYPPVALHDKSASVNGKPAGQMLGYWYPRISGR